MTIESQIAALDAERVKLHDQIGDLSQAQAQDEVQFKTATEGRQAAVNAAGQRIAEIRSARAALAKNLDATE